MSAPNQFLIYVTDTERSTRFYSELFDMEPVFVAPAYVAFEIAPGVLFALWSRHGETITSETPRLSEVGLMVPGSGEKVDEVYAEWRARGVTVVEEIRDDIFGRTFVIADPDGNRIRVAPVD
ncbi:VOC family protein [Leucobacter tenebrionis]|uniref:VOC family protein n=1 Tax=Leucobacter tenebrionis TaxID=2873270 RepID=UPI001CA60A9A|nr:VOC family protein [Leucobacter tenebrionis]QZY50884.1 VOC family protein [Leucobacter tenebrionis]